MSVGLAFIAKVLEDGQPLSFVSHYNLQASDFTKKEKRVLKVISEHAKNHKQLPKIETIERHTNVEFPEVPDEPPSYWVSEIKKRRGLSEIQKVQEELSEITSKGDLDKAKETVRKLNIFFLNQDHTSKIRELKEVARDVVADHDRVQRNPKIVRIPYGLPYIDEVTLGAQPGDTTAVVGATEIGKSFFLLFMSDNAFEVGNNIGFVTPEMRDIQQARRQLALRTHVSSTRIRMGRLSTNVGRRKIVSEVDKLQDYENMFWYIPGSALSSIEDIELIIMERHLDVVYVDSAYLIRSRWKSQNVWDNIMQSSAELKQISERTQVPIIGSYQFKLKGGGKIGNIYGGQAIAHNSSLVMGIEKPRGKEAIEWGDKEYRLFSLIKGREGERGKIKVLYDMYAMRIQQEEIMVDYRPKGVEGV